MKKKAAFYSWVVFMVCVLPGFAQLTPFHDFTGSGATGTGARPRGTLITDGSYFYGLTYQGGSNDEGVLFRTDLEGTGFTKLHNFSGATGGANPFLSLVTDGTFLYGTTSSGGTSNFGTIFRINNDGTGFTTLHNFNGTNGNSPQCTLVRNGTLLYGTTSLGGTNNSGVFFRISTSGTGYTVMHHFGGSVSGDSDGQSPQGSLLYRSNYVYGTTSQGGTSGDGIIYRMEVTDGIYSILNHFSNEENPRGGLTTDATHLYGMAFGGGIPGVNVGYIYKLQFNGTGFTTVFDFDFTTGGSPEGELLLTGNTLFGLTRDYGTNNAGTLFKIQTDGTDFQKLHEFDGAATGSQPVGGLMTDGLGLYGFTNRGGANDLGTIFRYLSRLSISSFTPASGPVGSTITINGTNFSSVPSANIVYFGATRATVIAATSTQLTVIVPIGATYESISVTVDGLTAWSKAPFLVTFADGGVINSCSFAAPVFYNSGNFGLGLALGDLDGDGKADIVGTHSGINALQVFRNVSMAGTINATSLATSVDLPTGANPHGVAIADIDGDGKLDLIATSKDANIMSIFRNISSTGSLISSSFEARVDFTTGILPMKVACQDLDGDGKTDIAITSNGAISLWRNISTVGSINTGSLSTRVDIGVPNSGGLAIADIDVDGKPDLIGGDGLGTTVGVLRNISTPGTLSTGSFAARVDFTVGPWVEFMAVGDLDKDNRPDIVTSHWPGGNISILKNTSTPGPITAGSFATKVDFTTSNEPRGVGITDYDGDGSPDIAVMHQIAGTVGIFKNIGSVGSITSGSFAPRFDFPAGGNTRSLVSGDIDGDGKPDIVVANYSGNPLSVVRNTVSSLPAPTGSGFSPTTGPIGTVVTITGTNFSTTPLNNTVKFNGVTATVASATSTSITAIVPVGATTGQISITVGCNTMITLSNFNVTIPPPLSNPTLVWAKKIGDNSTDYGTSIVTDAAGNLYTTGSFMSTVDFEPGPGETSLTASGSFGDVFVTKFNPAGNLVWAKRVGGTGNDYGSAIAVDASQNVYLTGIFSNTADFDPGPGTINLSSAGLWDSFILKLDANGNYVWADRVGGSSFDIAKDLALDASNDVLVTGTFRLTVDFDPGAGTTNFTATQDDAFVIKLNGSSGSLIWAKQITGLATEDSRSVAIDGSGNVHITGVYAGTVDFDSGAGSFPLTAAGNDAFVVKLEPDGDFIWAAGMGGNSDDVGAAIEVDGSGNVYSTGYFTYGAGTPHDFDPGVGVYNLTPITDFNASNKDIYVSKLNSSGVFVWASHMGGVGSEEPFSLTLDASGNVYTTGTFNGTVDFNPGGSSNSFTADGFSNIYISKLDQSGNFIWAEKPEGSYSGIGRGITIDNTNHVLVTGSFDSTVDFAPGACEFNLDGTNDIFIQKLSQTALPIPTITSLNPTSGPAGTLVTITGTNFDATAFNNIVRFAGLEATVLSSTTTSVIAEVPVGATDGIVTVSVGCNTATGPVFDVTGPCSLPLSERNALVELYNATDGSSWTNSTNWLSGDESTWFGVTVTGCRVREIDLSANQLSGTLPTTLGDLTFLEVLELDNNIITGTLPANIGNMVSLKEINVQQNQMNGNIPASLEDCIALENLHLEGNVFVGNIPVFIGDMNTLRSVNLGFNHFEGEIPPEIGNLSNLTFLSLANNWLYGEIPAELGQLAQLTLLDLSQNDFYNPIPPELGDLASLVSLQLWDNGFNGNIPFEIGDLTNLQELNLETNQLDGSVPTSLQNLTQLRIFSIANNEIDLVPDILGSLPDLESVDLRNNRLNTLPVFTSPSLTFLAVQNNRLHYGDMEPNSGVASYMTNPQALIPPGGDIFFTSGSTLTIPFTTPGTGNSYQWFKDGVAIPGANSATLSIPNASASNIGLYTVRITSSVVLYTVLESVMYTALTDPCPAGPRETGEIDSSFNPLVNVPTDMGALALQSSGKILLSAPSTTINGTSQDGILRFNTDGSLDATFQSIQHYPLTNQMLVQPDDKIVTKTGSMYSGTVERFDADGNPDAVFNSNMPSFYNATLYAVAIQSNGKILIALNEDGTPRLVRLNDDGSYDGSFVAAITNDATIVRVQSNDKILIDDSNTGGIIRLNADGSPDPSFAMTTSPGGITDIAIQTDGKILVTGSFDYFNGIPSRGLVRLNANGSIDDSFSTIVVYDPDISTYQGKIGLMADGSIILGGYFSIVEGAARNSLVRLNADGSVDCSFDPLLGPDNTINNLILQADGKILIAGLFTQYDGTVRNGFSRVNNSTISINVDFHPQNDTKCAGDLSFFTCVASGTTNMVYQWQFSSNGIAPYTNISNGGGYTNVNSLTMNVNTTGGFGEGFYRCKISGDLASVKFSNPAQLDVITPPTPIANDVTVCQGSSFTITASGGTNGNYRWADQEDLFSSQVNSVFSGDGATSYSLPFEVWVVEGSCQGTHVNVNVNFLTPPTAPTATDVTVCSSTAATLAAAGGSPGQYRWYTVSTGSSPISGEVNATYTTPALLTTSIYYVSIDNGSCESARTMVTATVIPAPTPPTVTPSTICSGNTATPTASGGTNGQYRWYTNPTGSTLATTSTNDSFITPTLTTSTTYYVALNDGTCESSRTTVTVTVQNLPSAPTVSNVSICSGTSANLSASGGSNGQYRWYANPTGSTLATTSMNSTFTTPSLSSTISYYVAINDGNCESTRTTVTVTILTCSDPPVINTTNITVTVQGNSSLDLLPLLSDPNNDIDLSTLTVSMQPTSGAVATISGTTLSIDYAGVNFSGIDLLRIRICDLNSNCTEQELSIEVVGEITVYNALSPEVNGQNDVFYLQYIDILESTKNNKVVIFNRWGDVVFEVDNYNNTTRVFRGQSSDGKDLPTGVYFYRITFTGGEKKREGFISLKR